MEENTVKKEFSKEKALEWMLNYAIYLVLVALLIAIIIKEPGFVSINNFTKILSQASTRVIMALGVGGIIISKGTDLSLGRQVGIAAVISASMLQGAEYTYRMYPDLPVLPLIVPLIIVICVTMAFSTINGFIVAKLNVDPFIATLGMMIIVLGANSLYYDRPPYGAQPIGGLDERFTKAATGSFNIFGFKLPYLIIYAIVITIIIWIIWNKTRFGKNIFAIGGNKEAALVSGVNVSKYTILIYTLGGALYGIGGFLEAARVGSATNNLGNMYELDAISACIVGGLSFDGGIGSVPGIVVGVLIFQVIAYGLTFIGVSPYYQLIIKGLIIIGAVAIDSRKHSKKK